MTSPAVADHEARSFRHACHQRLWGRSPFMQDDSGRCRAGGNAFSRDFFLPVSGFARQPSRMAVPHFHHAVESFATWLRVERNLSPRTRDAYAFDLGAFGGWLVEVLASDPIPLPAIRRDHIEEYVAYLRNERGHASSTLNRTLSCLRTFFRFCAEEKYIERNPATDIAPPKKPSKLPVYLGAEEVRRLFAAPDATTVAGRRDLAILTTLAFCGLRLQELVGLDTIDLDFSRDTVRVIGKGSKERLVPLNDDVKAALLAMLQDPDRRPAEAERAVFLNKNGRRIGGRAVQYIVDRHIRAAGIDRKGVSPHKLRHTFATLLHDRDVDLVDIQSLLGHASLASTQIYTHTNVRRLQKTIDLLEVE